MRRPWTSRFPAAPARALQTTLNRLRESVRHAERQRVILHEMATHDSLTGLLNRQAARSALRPRTGPGTPRIDGTVMMLYVDLDNLKTINDSYGHRVGDDAIRLTGRHFATGARESDIVARVGGDEFLVAGPADEHERGAGPRRPASRRPWPRAELDRRRHARPLALQHRGELLGARRRRRCAGAQGRSGSLRRQDSAATARMARVPAPEPPALATAWPASRNLLAVRCVAAR